MTVTIGSGAKDLHGNPLLTSMTIVFTAGDSILGGEVKGRIYGDPPLTGMMAGAWLVTDTTDISPDSILAPFLTQASDLGVFSLQYLPAGLYTIVCWEDKNRDKLYQPGLDRLAIAWKDVDVLPDSSIELNLFATKRDTVKLSVFLLRPTDNRHLQLRLSKKLTEMTTDWSQAIHVEDSLGNELKLYSVWIEPLDSSRINYFTALQDENMRYAAVVAGDTGVFDFSGGPKPDTTGAAISLTFPTPNARDVSLEANGFVAFDDQISGDSLIYALTLTVSDSVSYPIDVSHPSPNILKWKVEHELATDQRCLISLDLSKVFNSEGVVAGDTIWTLFFTTLDPGGTGEIAGQVISLSNNNIKVSAKRIGVTKLQPNEVKVSPDGTFIFRYLAPGDYELWSWKDSDGNGKFNFGNLTPFQHSESFAFLQDTITVRARWESGGVILHLP